MIGDEILSGKFPDANSPWLLARLRTLGVRVRQVQTVPDDVGVIADTVAAAAAGADWVLTTGGVGPTHDDVTMEGIARAFGQDVIEHPELGAIVRAHHGSPEALRMARVPREARLVHAAGLRFPQVVVRNVWVFPGVPYLLRLKFDAVAGLLGGRPVEAAAVYTTDGESEIAAVLDAVVAAHPRVAIGSYPRFGAPGWRVLLTVEADERPPVDAAVGDLVARLGAERVFRVVARYDPAVPDGT